jgi:hypothetical protein
MAVIATGLFVLMLRWMTRVPVRGWSGDPVIRREQVLLVMTVTAVVIVGYGANCILNRHRAGNHRP